MSISTYLFVWMTLAANSQGFRFNTWTNQGTFNSVQSCEKAARNLGIDYDKYRCINVNGEMK